MQGNPVENGIRDACSIYKQLQRLKYMVCSAIQVAKHGEIAHLKTTEAEGRTAPVWTDRWVLMKMKHTLSN